MSYPCYQCNKETEWLAPDARCGDCTRVTPAETRGDEEWDDTVYEERCGDYDHGG